MNARLRQLLSSRKGRDGEFSDNLNDVAADGNRHPCHQVALALCPQLDPQGPAVTEREGVAPAQLLNENSFSVPRDVRKPLFKMRRPYACRCDGITRSSAATCP